MSHLGEHDVYIGREARLGGRNGRFLAASKWANPFKLRGSSSRADCISRFASYLRASPNLMAAIKDLAGKQLLCHCPLHVPCHADALIDAFVEQQATKESRDTTVHIGVHFSPEEFAQKALELRHPFEDHASLPSVIRGLQVRMSTSVADVTAQRRGMVA